MMDETIQDRRPSPAEVIGYVAEKEIRRLVRTALPAVVQSYDPANQTAEVQPAIRRRKSGGAYQEPPVTVPVMPIQGAGFVIHVPLSAGDTVWLSVGERSIDEWLLAGDVEDDVTASDPRRYDLQDAVAFHGPSIFADPIPSDMAESDAMSIGERDGTTRVRIATDGSVEIRTGGATLTLENGGAVTIDSNNIKLGGSGASDAVALAPTINSYFIALHTALSGFVPVPGDGGAALKAAYIAALSAAGIPPTGPLSVAASKVDAE